MKNYLEIIRRIIREKDIIPKLASILLAVGFWAYISSIETGSLRFKVPLNYKNLDQNLTVSKISGKNILVVVRGGKEELKNASIKNIRLYIDLASAEPGVYKTYKVQEQKGDIPEGFDVEFDPAEVKVMVDKKYYRNVRVIPRYSGNVQKGFIMARIRPDPEYVRISGPEEVVRKINAIYTENIPLDERKSVTKETVRLEKINDEDIEYGISKVSVTIPVLAFSDITVVDIPLAVKNRKKGYRYVLQNESIRVNLCGIDGKTPDVDMFSAYIDVMDIELDDRDFQGRKTVEKNVQVHVRGAGGDEENSIVQVVPDSVDVQVIKE